MLSGESTPLLKESIQLLDSKDKLDVDGVHKNAVLFSGTKVLQASPMGTSDNPHCIISLTLPSRCQDRDKLLQQLRTVGVLGLF